MPSMTDVLRGHFVSTALLTCAMGTLLSSADIGQAQDIPAATPADIFRIRLDLLGTRVTPGDEESAKAYYERLGRELGMPGGKLPGTLDGLLRYFGYYQLSARDLDKRPSHELMSSAALGKVYPDAPELQGPWDVLAAAYFAPKTSDVSGRSNKISWRKVVRLRPRPKSNAELDQLSALYFLSVVYVPADNRNDPFKQPTTNVQVMLIQKPKQPNSKMTEPAAFLVFDPANGYSLGLATSTSWDAADPALTHGLRPYYVPQACIQCHGGDQKVATLHFFDTDYSFDKAGLGEDFAQSIGKGPFGPLFDAGKETKSPQFAAGFQVFKRLNSEIFAHNQSVQATSLAARGAENWMRVHDDNSAHIEPLKRAWPAEGQQWDPDRKADRVALPLLVRYCFRCHGTIHYNVLWKSDDGNSGQTVADWLDDMIDNVEEGRMPEDRRLTDATRKQLVDALRALK